MSPEVNKISVKIVPEIDQNLRQIFLTFLFNVGFNFGDMLGHLGSMLITFSGKGSLGPAMGATWLKLEKLN